MNLQEQIARIDRAQEDLRKFVDGQHKLTREATLADWRIVIAGMIVGAALFAAGMAVMKLLGT